MKTSSTHMIGILAGVLIFLFGSSSATAQDTLRTRTREQKQDQTKEQKQNQIKDQTKDQTKEQEQQRIRERSRFVDKNANGVDDALEAKGKKRGMTRFIDADGDGIADDRARGMGFKWGKGAAGSPMDKASPGGKKYRGGKNQ